MRHSRCSGYTKCSIEAQINELGGTYCYLFKGIPLNPFTHDKKCPMNSFSQCLQHPMITALNSL